MWGAAMQKSSHLDKKTRLCRQLAVLVLILTSLVACSEKPQDALRISAVLWPGYEPLFLAKRLGFFDDQPIQIVDYLSNTDAMQAFHNQKLEAGAFTLDEALNLLGQGDDIQIILVLDISNGGDVIIATPNISSINQLKDKRIAVEENAVGGFILARALAINNMNYNDVITVPISPMEQETEFTNKNIDAAVSFDPYRTHLIKKGYKEIFNSSEIPNEIIDVLVIRTDYLTQNPEIIQTLTNAWFKALNYQKQHPRESAKLSINRFNTTVDDYLAGLSRLHFPNRNENKTLLTASTSSLMQTSLNFFPIMKNLGSLSKPVDIKAHLNNRFVSTPRQSAPNE